MFLKYELHDNVPQKSRDFEAIKIIKQEFLNKKIGIHEDSSQTIF